MNRVYFIGSGPGAPELLTLKGARLLADCPTVFAFSPYAETFAALLRGKTVLEPFDFSFRELLDTLHTRLATGSVAFLVPGDLTFFSPFQALIDALGSLAEVIPGVGTANAASALLKRTLNLSRVCNRAVIVSPRILDEQLESPRLEDLAVPGATLLIYMNTRPLSELVEQLRRGYGQNVPIALCHRLGLPGEEVLIGTLDDIVAQVGDRDLFQPEGPSRRSALTFVLVGESLTAAADGDWWDRRCEQIRQQKRPR